MSDLVNIIGSFADEEKSAHAIEELRHSGIGTVRAFTPFPSEKIQEAMARPKSPVRAWVLTGGITGALTGFALTIGLSMYWPHYVGGKPIVSIPPFVIIAFELMILFGALMGVAGFIFHGRFPQFDPIPGYSGRFSANRFGVVVCCTENDAARAEKMLGQAGAEQIEREAA
ncbi:MAG: DUF3341 domain-containing protein [Candidatus Binataceae bacterium]|jgi:hypothetical protein